MLNALAHIHTHADARHIKHSNAEYVQTSIQTCIDYFVCSETNSFLIEIYDSLLIPLSLSLFLFLRI